MYNVNTFKTCPICGRDASYSFDNYEKRAFCLCRNDICGHSLFRSADKAMIEQNLTDREQWSEAARQAKVSGKWLALVADGEKTFRGDIEPQTPLGRG